MTARISLAVILLALGASFAVGCGGDDDEASTSSATTPAAAITNAATTTAAPTEASTTGTAVVPTNLKEAVKACKDQINSSTGLDDGAKRRLSDICDKAASGDPQDALEASSEACKEIAKSLAPEGALRDQALAACGQS